MTVRNRFVAFDLADGWIEPHKLGHWILKHPERRGELIVSMFPVAEGVVMDLASIQALSRDGQRRAGERRRRVPNPGPFFERWLLLDEASWTLGSVFCVGTSTRTERPSVGRSPLAVYLHPVTYTRHWTVCDGAHVVEATFYEYDEEMFRVGVQDCDAMMRSVRFEGPN
jgi:hypothetical protein